MSRASLAKRTSTLDSQAIEAVVRFVRVLARCGCTPKDIAQEVLKAGREIPKSWAQTAKSAIREIDVAVHVLTVWFAEPAYLDPKGNPRPLPLHGPGPSLEALSMRVDRSLDPKKCCAICWTHGRCGAWEHDTCRGIVWYLFAALAGLITPEACAVSWPC
jgi:hypothetical protein